VISKCLFGLFHYAVLVWIVMRAQGSLLSMLENYRGTCLTLQKAMFFIVGNKFNPKSNYEKPVVVGSLRRR